MITLAPTSILACATCRGDAGTIAAAAQDSAVVVMLACLAFIFSIVFYFIFSIARRQRLVAAAEADLAAEFS
jgi:heme/copper-type cytochrome/quinol oxidase subunit 2